MARREAHCGKARKRNDKRRYAVCTVLGRRKTRTALHCCGVSAGAPPAAVFCGEVNQLTSEEHTLAETPTRGRSSRSVIQVIFGTRRRSFVRRARGDSKAARDPQYKFNHKIPALKFLLAPLYPL